MLRVTQRFLSICVMLLVLASNTWGQSTCTILASGLTFQDPAPASAGFALSKILADNDAVYWFEFNAAQGSIGGALNRVLKLGGPVTVLATGLGSVNDFELDDTHLYWTETAADGEGTVKRIPKNGGTVDVLASGMPSGSAFAVFAPQGLALDTAFVYWGEEVGGAAIRRVPKAGGTVVDIGRGENFKPTSIALDASFIYIAEAKLGGRILRLPLSGGSVETLASGYSNPVSLVLDGELLYWVELIDPGSIFTMATTGGAISNLAIISGAHNIALDATSLYYDTGPLGNEPGNRTISKLPKGGGLPVVAADCGDPNQGGFLSPIYVAVDETSLYISDTGSAATGAGRVFKVLKDELPLELDLLTNKQDFGPGDSMTVFVEVSNPGIQKLVDFYFGALLPDGVSVVFVDLTFTGAGSLLDLAALSPLVENFDLSSSFQFTDPSFLNFEWEGTEPQGNYTLFLVAVQAGGFADGSADTEDIVALATLAISFTPTQ